jgi:hypothetical protein
VSLFSDILHPHQHIINRQFRNPGGPLLPHPSARRGGIDALPNQELPRSLIQQGETKQIAAKMKMKERDRNDTVINATRAKELRFVRGKKINLKKKYF